MRRLAWGMLVFSLVSYPIALVLHFTGTTWALDQYLIFISVLALVYTSIVAIEESGRTRS